ncbi:lymphocyte antigen 6G6e isoform X2 [Alligator mississippiensis]|uniref:Lymphocyte antigen 6 complex locus protein G6c n=1 Tax=Alligator mississippiensis TaxID=8496 RepID=A0A151NCA9_ALLMI|nr:lymphocyte antigen 6G6e isoform X2 [Alligator mississippiensis]KYO34431.1 lymphocyte antigen 6 complex locus protein G6c [Alligator mississippiensis]
MGRLLLGALLVLGCLGLGLALQCLKCSFTVFDLPCHTSPVTCEAEQACAIIRGHAAGKKLIKRKNCVPLSKCHSNDTTTYLGISYVTSYECCRTDFCNSRAGAGPHLPLATGLVALGVWLARGF